MVVQTRTRHHPPAPRHHGSEDWREAGTELDPALLGINPPQPELIHKARHYSVWNKPAGVLAQGTRFADHCCLPRLAQTILGARSELHPGTVWIVKHAASSVGA